MHALRFAALPIQHVVAELAAFPFHHEAGFQTSLVALDPTMEQSSTRLAWREAERFLTDAFPGFSLDETVAVRDWLWFANDTLAVPMHRYLRRLSESFLSVIGGAATPSFGFEDDQASHTPSRQVLARQAWRWLTFALPPDLLLAALPDANGAAAITPQLDRLLRDKGFAEPHLHLGAGLGFPDVWESMLDNIGSRQLRADTFRSPGAALADGTEIGSRLVVAACLRALLMQFLTTRREADRLSNFTALAVTGIGADAPLYASALSEGASAFAAGRSDHFSTGFDFVLWQRLYARLTATTCPQSGPRGGRTGTTFGELSGTVSGHSETLFLRAGLRYLTEDELRPPSKRDWWFAELFWQLVRLRVVVYRHLVQRPLIPGLQWFIRTYARLKPAVVGITTKRRILSAARLSGLGHGLRSLEVRTSPKARYRLLRREWQQFDDGRKALAAEDPRLEFGVVLHLTKERSEAARHGIPPANWRGSHADPSGRANACRYSAYYLERRRAVMATVDFLRRQPAALEMIRGLDVCTDELGVPNWVLLPLIRYAREAAAEIAVASYQEPARPSALRTAPHVGEDFVHVLTGLRNVGEVLDHYGLSEGDRIGHAISLGIDTAEWARRVRQVPMMLEDRLFDLVWLWTFCERRPTSAQPFLGHRLLAEIDRLSVRWLGEPRVDGREVAILAASLFSESDLVEAGFPSGRQRQMGSDRRTALSDRRRNQACSQSRVALLRRFLCDPLLFDRGRQVIWVDVESEIETITAVQQELRRTVASRAITVEVNPSSNLLIGRFGDLAGHPMWRLKPPLGDGPHPLSICIGTDDPISFTSDLRNEYQLVEDSLMAGGLSEDQARQWIDEVREAGMLSRFTFAHDRFVGHAPDRAWTWNATPPP